MIPVKCWNTTCSTRTCTGGLSVVRQDSGGSMPHAAFNLLETRFEAIDMEIDPSTRTLVHVLTRRSAT